MNKCIKCGSYAFNLYKEGIDQGGLCDVHYWQGRAHRAEALAQSEQEPFCWCIESQDSADWCFAKTEEGVKSNSVFIDDEHGSITDPFPLYTTPPRRTWVSLSDEDIERIAKKARSKDHAITLAQRELKEKNT